LKLRHNFGALENVMSQEFAELLPHSAKFGKIGMGAAQKKEQIL